MLCFGSIVTLPQCCCTASASVKRPADCGALFSLLRSEINHIKYQILTRIGTGQQRTASQRGTSHCPMDYAVWRAREGRSGAPGFALPAGTGRRVAQRIRARARRQREGEGARCFSSGRSIVRRAVRVRPIRTRRRRRPRRTRRRRRAQIPHFPPRAALVASSLARCGAVRPRFGAAVVSFPGRTDTRLSLQIAARTTRVIRTPARLLKTKAQLSFF